MATHRLPRPARHHDGASWLPEHLPLRVPPAEGAGRRQPPVLILQRVGAIIYADDPRAFTTRFDHHLKQPSPRICSQCV